MSCQCGCGCSNQTPQPLDETFNISVETAGCGCQSEPQQQENCCPCRMHCGCPERRRRECPCDTLASIASSGPVTFTCQATAPATNCDDPDVPVCCCCGDSGYPRCRFCCDQNGCCRIYPCSWRNKFWPEFTHPRWLCCKDLYNVR